MASVFGRQREEKARIAKTVGELTLKNNTERGFRILDRNFVSELHSKDLRMFENFTISEQHLVAKH